MEGGGCEAMARAPPVGPRAGPSGPARGPTGGARARTAPGRSEPRPRSAATAPVVSAPSRPAMAARYLRAAPALSRLTRCPLPAVSVGQRRHCELLEGGGDLGKVWGGEPPCPWGRGGRLVRVPCVPPPPPSGVCTLGRIVVLLFFLGGGGWGWFCS